MTTTDDTHPLCGHPKMTDASHTRLADVIADPERAVTVPVEMVPALLCQLAAIQSRLSVRLVDAERNRRSREGAHGDRLLTVDEIARRMTLSRDYVYRHAHRFPFTRRVGRALRFSERGLEKWLAAQRTP